MDEASHTGEDEVVIAATDPQFPILSQYIRPSGLQLSADDALHIAKALPVSETLQKYALVISDGKPFATAFLVLVFNRQTSCVSIDKLSGVNTQLAFHEKPAWNFSRGKTAGHAPDRLKTASFVFFVCLIMVGGSISSLLHAESPGSHSSIRFMATAVDNCQKAVVGPHLPATLEKSLQDGFDSDAVENVMNLGVQDPERKPQVAAHLISLSVFTSTA
jgi:hypothetical protein